MDSAHQRRWSDLDDGPLLAAAEAEYDAFMTVDQNLRFSRTCAGGSCERTEMDMQPCGPASAGDTSDARHLDHVQRCFELAAQAVVAGNHHSAQYSCSTGV